MQVRQVPLRQELGTWSPACSAAGSNGWSAVAAKLGPPDSKETVKRAEGAPVESKGAWPLSLMAHHNQRIQTPI